MKKLFLVCALFLGLLFTGLKFNVSASEVTKDFVNPTFTEFKEIAIDYGFDWEKLTVTELQIKTFLTENEDSPIHILLYTYDKYEDSVLSDTNLKGVALISDTDRTIANLTTGKDLVLFVTGEQAKANYLNLNNDSFDFKTDMTYKVAMVGEKIKSFEFVYAFDNEETGVKAYILNKYNDLKSWYNTKTEKYAAITSVVEVGLSLLFIYLVYVLFVKVLKPVFNWIIPFKKRRYRK